MISETFKKKICSRRISNKRIFKIVEKEIQDSKNVEEIIEFLSKHRPDFAIKILSSIPGF